MIFHISRGIKDIHGYSWKGREILERSDLIESKESFDVSSWGPNSKFPDDEDGTSDFRLKVKCLAHQSVILARRLIRCLATDLGADPLQFLQDHSEMFTGRGNNATSIRLLHYPKIETDIGSKGACGSSGESCITRCGEHTDYGGLTLLYQVYYFLLLDLENLFHQITNLSLSYIPNQIMSFIPK